jgi:hypothetical protein
MFANANSKHSFASPKYAAATIPIRRMSRVMDRELGLTATSPVAT